MHVALFASSARSLVNFRLPLIQELRARGVEVSAFAPDGDDGTRQHLAKLDVEVSTIHMNRRSVDPMEDLATARELARALRSRRIDLVVPYTPKPILVTSLALATASGFPPVVPMFTGLGELSAAKGPRWYAAWVLLRGLRKASPHAIVQHEGDAKWLVRRGIFAAGQVRIVPGSGVDTERFAPDRDERHGTEPMFLFLGRMVPSKGVDAFARLATDATCNTRVRAGWVAAGRAEVGVGHDRLLGTLDKAGVSYVGHVSKPEEQLRRATALVLLTSYGEGIPRVILEAMACGTPVVCSPHPGCLAAISHEEHGYIVQPWDLTSARGHISALSEDEELVRRMGAAGRQRAVSQFSAKRVASVTADAILQS